MGTLLRRVTSKRKRKVLLILFLIVVGLALARIVYARTPKPSTRKVVSRNRIENMLDTLTVEGTAYSEKIWAQTKREQKLKEQWENQRKAPKRISQNKPRSVSVPTVSAVPAGKAQSYALSVVGSSQFASLKSLWSHESGWRTTAMNPSSGACGIPQALPCSKIINKCGSNWRSDYKCQIDWGIGYIRGRYGSPNAAWQHFLSHNWY